MAETETGYSLTLVDVRWSDIPPFEIVWIIVALSEDGFADLATHKELGICVFASEEALNAFVQECYFPSDAEALGLCWDDMAELLSGSPVANERGVIFVQNMGGPWLRVSLE